MCSRISWPQFLSTLLFLVTGYYAVIVFLKYRQDILQWCSSKLHPRADRTMGTTAAAVDEPPGPCKKPATSISNEAGKYTATHELTHDLQMLFTAAAQKKTGKPELVAQVSNTLKEYAMLKGTDLEGEIIRHIADQAKERCSVLLSKDDLDMLWKD